MVRATLGRWVDGFISRGEGLDARGDPFGPPLDAAETTRLLEIVKTARFTMKEGRFHTPIPVVESKDDVHLTFRPPVRGRDWVVLAHPYGAGVQRGKWGLYEMHARFLSRRGLGVVFVEGPYHGGRAFGGHESGYGFVRADLGHTARALIAYAADVAATVRHLREAHDAAHIGGMGLSLGGAAVGLASALAASFDALAFIAAVDNPASFYETGQNREARRRTLIAAGYDNARVAHGFAPIAPSTYDAPEALRKWFIPEQDLVVPARTQHAWHASWGGEATSLPAEGHALALASPVVAAATARWFRDAFA